MNQILTFYCNCVTGRSPHPLSRGEVVWRAGLRLRWGKGAAAAVAAVVAAATAAAVAGRTALP